jgi:hypothetical protein
MIRIACGAAPTFLRQLFSLDRRLEQGGASGQPLMRTHPSRTGFAPTAPADELRKETLPGWR